MTMLEELRASGRNPRFHGNGFVQLYLDDRTRLHIWTPLLPPIRSHNATIHTHRYDVASTVILGVLHHTTIDMVEFSSYPTCKVVNLTGHGTVGIDKRAQPGEIDPGSWRHSVRHEYWFAAGSRYTFQGGLFHDSDNGHDGMTVTVFKKTSDDDFAGFAKILLVGTDEQPVHAFDPKYQPTQEKLWEVIARAVEYCGDGITQARKSA